MRTSNICPTCSTFSNALCTLYNGDYLPTLDINTLDSLETALIKIEAYLLANPSGGSTLYSANGIIPEDRTITIEPNNFVSFETTGSRPLLSFFYSEGATVGIDTDNLEISASNGLFIDLGYTATQGQYLGYDEGTGSVGWFDSNKTNGYTVGTLPAGVAGMRAHVTDATAPTYLGALVGGGAITCPVFYNGSAWVSA